MSPATFIPALSLLTLLLPRLASAQTFTSCNPLNTTTCPSNPALSTNHTFDLLTSSFPDSAWNTTAGTLTYPSSGADFTIATRGDTPTIQSKFYLFGGECEVWLRAAPGQGVVSSIVLQSDDLDEVDWELVGGNNTHVQSNYFGKGNTTSYDRALWHPVADPQKGFHNYTTRWTHEQLEWFIDGAPIRTLKYAEANGGKNFPQTPMNVRIGVWAAGDKDNNNYTVEWAGGVTDYNKGPYTMSVSSVRVRDFSSGKEYSYGDTSGSWESIKIAPGNSTISDELNKPPPMTASQRWNHLSSEAKAGVGGGIGASFVVMGLLAAVYCVRQRRSGRRERALADGQFESKTRELMEYRAKMSKGGFAVSSREV
ncbi:MAG: hypothetical protein LQ350_007890 [Teloschistes chrysophthalmus]|nr:MAG: hypothetical protein LQ350_007890 [Niorma chrysophthalma]